MAELERLQKNVVDTKAAFAAGGTITIEAAHEDGKADYSAAWFKAKLELEDYLKEQD